MPHILITGGSGFFGGILKRRLLDEGFSCINLDLVPDADHHPNLISIQGDLRDKKLLAAIFHDHEISAVMHCAALLAHGSIDEKDLWTSNVDGTRNLAEACRAPAYTSSSSSQRTAYGPRISVMPSAKTTRPRRWKFTGARS